MGSLPRRCSEWSTSWVTMTRKREMILGGLLGLLEGAPGRASLGRAIAEAVQSLVPCTAEVETLVQKCGALVKEDGAVWRD
jgi:hypothetical protein